MTLFNVNGVNINYAEEGDGETIVFLHGYTGSNRDWDNQLAVIREDYRTIAFDHRGHGRSGAPASEDGYSIKIFSEDVYTVLTNLGVARCYLVGHSMGGFMSLQFALDHPDMVKALVLVDTSSGDWEMAPGYEQFRTTLDDLARNKGLEAAFEYDVANNPVKIEKFKQHPELKEVARQKVMNTSVDGYVHVAGTFRKWPPVTSRLGEIHAPALIVVGEEDVAFHKASQMMQEGIKDAELVTIPGAGHNPHEETPDLFNQAFLKFLEKTA